MAWSHYISIFAQRVHHVDLDSMCFSFVLFAIPKISIAASKNRNNANSTQTSTRFIFMLQRFFLFSSKCHSTAIIYWTLWKPSPHNRNKQTNAHNHFHFNCIRLDAMLMLLLLVLFMLDADDKQFNFSRSTDWRHFESHLNLTFWFVIPFSA